MDLLFSNIRLFTMSHHSAKLQAKINHKWIFWKTITLTIKTIRWSYLSAWILILLNCQKMLHISEAINEVPKYYLKRAYRRSSNIWLESILQASHKSSRTTSAPLSNAVYCQVWPNEFLSIDPSHSYFWTSNLSPLPYRFRWILPIHHPLCTLKKIPPEVRNYHFWSIIHNNAL